jgi:hypothetical protein
MKTQKSGVKRLLRRRGSLSALVYGLALLSASLTPFNAGAGQRPVSDFLAAQGTYCLNLDGRPPCVLLVPPSPNMIAWTSVDPVPTLALLDYAGLENYYLVSHYGRSLGTTISGSINERPLANGRAQVDVTLHTKNALVWVSNMSTDFPGPLLFGHRLDEVVAGATPALADSTFRVVFNNTAPGAPLPDLIRFLAPNALLPGQELRFISLYARGTGPFPDGSPGEVVIAQSGIFVTPGIMLGKTEDGFPVERIDLHPIGK